MAAAAQANHRGGAMKVDTLLAGGIAGGCARTITAPLDRVKILMQTQRLTSGGAEDKYRGLWQSLVRVYKEDGVRSYWRGNLANCVRVVPYSATQFMTFAHCKDVICQYTGKEHPTVPQRLGCGAIAGMMASFVTHPLDVVRTRMAVQVSNLASQAVCDADTHIFAAMYKGLGPTLASLGPFVAVNFASYDTIKQYAHGRGIAQTPFTSLFMGAGAGIIAQTACYPLDTIRRRMQLKGRNYKNTFDAMKVILQQEGAAGLYKGMSANTLKVIPNNAIRFMVFEYLKSSKTFKAMFHW